MIVFRDLILKFPAVQTLVAPFYDSFAELLDREKQGINVMQKSDYTLQIAEADRRIDRTLVGMRKIIMAALHHFDPAVVEAARSLRNRLEAFGNIVRKAYEVKIPDVNILISDFRSDKYATKVALAGLTPWINELQSAETAFEHLIVLRNTESAQKPRERLRSIKNRLSVTYRHIAGYINAAVTLENATAAPGTYGEFIAELNVEIAYFNRYTHHHARRDIGAGGHCTVESIPGQPCTGKAVTPLPTVCYREEGKPDAELVFARDFTVTYRNNVNPGMADLIIHGKGAYRGQKKITFTILGAI